MAGDEQAQDFFFEIQLFNEGIIIAFAEYRFFLGQFLHQGQQGPLCPVVLFFLDPFHQHREIFQELTAIRVKTVERS